MGSEHLRVRRAVADDHAHMLILWERSVRVTHHFLTEDNIVTLRPLVAQLFGGDACEFWVAVQAQDVPLGFLGYTRDSVDALFIDADHRGGGIGTLLISHAQLLSGGALRVEVNEQNEGAVGFYEAQGFRVFSRSPLDSAGRPFPLLHMQRPAPAR